MSVHVRVNYMALSARTPVHVRNQNQFSNERAISMKLAAHVATLLRT